MKVLILGYSNIVRKRVLSVLKEKKITLFVASKSYKQKIPGIKKQFKSDYSISITGNAGPSTDGEKSKVGDCFIAISSENEIFCEKFKINKSREDFIEAVKNISFQLFYDKIIIQ